MTFDEIEANRLNQAISSAWSSKDPTNIIRITEPNILWRNNESVYVGRIEIWAALCSRWQHMLHFQMRQDLMSFSAHCITVRFESEWQSSLHGEWYREGGHVQFTFDAHQLITKIESELEVQSIRVQERRMSLFCPH